ncbi:MAG: 2-phospho-L-lactate guanylyltransferase, partial [Caldilineaceae bacterium SB0668_bin_21]|nr:2-phospho-L-lactate guanylyltransferase [Caldilineaceae bacterium SB0668_bin_21]
DGGTNALMLQPPQAIPFAFGRDSFLRHQRLAAQAGIPVHVVESDSLLFDIDLPEDYRLVFNHHS